MRLLHTMLRVGDLDRSIGFYTDVLGMRLLRRRDYPDGKFTLAFVGYQDESEGAAIELTYNWGIDRYELGTAFGHVAIEADETWHDGDRLRAGSRRLQDRAHPEEGELSTAPAWSPAGSLRRHHWSNRLFPVTISSTARENSAR
jgi:lactoylglutathione lyase